MLSQSIARFVWGQLQVTGFLVLLMFTLVFLPPPTGEQLRPSDICYVTSHWPRLSLGPMREPWEQQDSVSPVNRVPARTLPSFHSGVPHSLSSTSVSSPSTLPTATSIARTGTSWAPLTSRPSADCWATRALLWSWRNS